MKMSVENIKEFVARYCDVSVKDLEGMSRKKSIVEARHVAMFLCRHYTSKSFDEIGDVFGMRDNSSVQYACRRVKDNHYTTVINIMGEIENV